jgi:hypothetical protein
VEISYCRDLAVKETILVIAWCTMIGIIVFVVGHRLLIGVTPNWLFIPIIVGGVIIVLLSFGASSKSDESKKQ